MPLHPKLQTLFDLLPDKCPTIFVAGGAAVDFEKATDVDLFILNNNESYAKRMIQSFEGPSELTYYKDDDAKADRYIEDGGRVIGTIYPEAVGKAVQVLTSAARTVEDCLKNFDISTHMWAVDYTGRGIQIELSTNVLTPPRIYKATRSTSTFQRYIKICNRYGYTPDVKHLMTWC